MRKLSLSDLYVDTCSLNNLMVDCWVTVRILLCMYTNYYPNSRMWSQTYLSFFWFPGWSNSSCRKSCTSLDLILRIFHKYWLSCRSSWPHTETNQNKLTHSLICIRKCYYKNITEVSFTTVLAWKGFKCYFSVLCWYPCRSYLVYYSIMTEVWKIGESLVLQGKKPLWLHRVKWEDNTKMCVRLWICKTIRLSQDKINGWFFLVFSWIFGFHIKTYWTAE